MPQLILGLVGLQGCGKGTIAATIREQFGAEVFRFSAILQDILERLHLEPRRETYTKLSETLRTTFGEDAFSYTITKDALASPAPIVVIDGIRRIEDIAALETIPQFHLIAVHASPESRFARMRHRGEKADERELTWEQFLRDEQAPTERSVPQVIARAEFQVSNDGTLADLQTAIQQLLHNSLLVS